MKRGGSLPEGWQKSDINELINWIADYNPDVDLIDKILKDCATSSDKIQCAFTQMALGKHDQLSFSYENYRNEQIDIHDFLTIHGPEKYLAAATLYESYMEEVGTPPTDPYMWQLMMEVFADELGPLLLELIPGGIGDLIGVYNSYQSGDYWSASVGIVLSMVPLNEVSNVIKNSKSIKAGFKSCYKVVTLWNKLFILPGGQKVLNKMPQAWKSLPGSKLADGEGLYWSKNQFNNFRLMDGNPNSNFNNQKNPYVRVTKNGSRLDKFGNPVDPNNPNFQELTHIPLTEITDDFLDLFFN